MSRKTIQILATTVVVLAVLLWAIRSNNSNDASSPTQLLLPDLQSVANAATEIRISGSSDESDVTIHRDGDAWLLGARDDYAADLGKIRQLMIALADAKIVEEKTSDEEKFDRLGVGDPDNGGEGLEVSIVGPEFSYVVILGKTAQRKYRYARIKGETKSYLINQNPNIPVTVTDWLLPDLVNIDSKRIKSVKISHVGGDTLYFEKDKQEQADFLVRDIPKNRELSYSAVGNSIASALANLKLENVRKRIDATPSITTEYQTWDGLVLTVDLEVDNDVTWAAFSAKALPVEASEPADADGAQESAASERTLEADAINKRLSGWQYQLGDYKKGLMTREWKDILQQNSAETAK
jgi:hypothetical protein